MNQILRHNGKVTGSYQLEQEVAQKIQQLAFSLSALEGRRVTQGEVIKRAIASLEKE